VKNRLHYIPPAIPSEKEENIAQYLKINKSLVKITTSFIGHL
jgi:hypothetical protein